MTMKEVDSGQVEAEGVEKARPHWQGMSSGGNWGTPLIEFAGNFKGWSEDDGQFGISWVLEFDRVEVVRSDAPYTSAEATVSIRASNALNSGWGIFGESLAKAQGVELDNLNLDGSVGQTWHMVREDAHDFGFKVKETGRQAVGTVWTVVTIVAPGQPVVPVEVPKEVVPVVESSGTSVAVEPTPVETVAVTAEERALQLLNGRNKATFFQIVLPDDMVKKDSTITSEIINDTFIQARIASGKVTVDEDGVHTVVG